MSLEQVLIILGTAVMICVALFVLFFGVVLLAVQMERRLWVERAFYCFAFGSVLFVASYAVARDLGWIE